MFVLSKSEVSNPFAPSLTKESTFKDFMYLNENIAMNYVMFLIKKAMLFINLLCCSVL